MHEVQVECYAGHRADQRPLRFIIRGHSYEVAEVEDQWYSPEAIYFRVVADDGNRYVLRHDERTDVWTLEAFRSLTSASGDDTTPPSQSRN